MPRFRSPILVGRDDDLALIDNALGGALAGSGACVFVLGEAGSGKTRLLQEAQEIARGAGMVVMGGSPGVISPPAFGVLAEALRSHFRTRELPRQKLGAFASGIHQIMPEWPVPEGRPALSQDQLRLLANEGGRCVFFCMGPGTPPFWWSSMTCRPPTNRLSASSTTPCQCSRAPPS